MKYVEWQASVPDEIKGDSLWRLEVYRLALFSADISWQDALALNKTPLTRDLADQLYRAVCSISANIAEGYSRSTGKDRLGFWRHRVAILRKILDLGYSPLVSDIDAIWLRDPVPYIAGQPQDAIFSPGSIFPEEAHSVWGNVLCAGPCLLRPTPAVLTFLDQVWPHLRTQDDQAAINRQLLTLGLEFEPADLYPMPFRGRDVLQSRDTRTGTVGDLSVALLPNRLFQRLQEPGEPEPLVIHPVSPKVEDTKIAHFREIGLWFEDLMSEAAPR